MKLAKLFLALEASILVAFSNQVVLAQTDFWQQTNGPSGGTVKVVAVNKTNGYIFAFVEGAGMFRSTDDGESWVPANSGLHDRILQTIAINSHGDVFAGTNDQGVFRSTNHGESWLQVNSGIAATHRNIRALAVNSSTGDLFAGASLAGLYRSRDNGNTWAPLPTGLSGAVTIQALALKQGTSVVFAGTDNRGVLRSTDNGNTWTPIDTSSIYKNIRTLIVAASGAVFAGADSASVKRAILLSTDNGESWKQVLSPASSVMWFALNSSDHIWAGTAGSGVYVSADNGGNWQLRNNGLRGYSILTIAFTANNHVFAGAHCSGIFRSTNDGASWEAMNNGLSYTKILSLAASPTTGTIVAGSHCGGVFRSSDSGNNWSWAGLPGASVRALIGLSNGYFLVGTARLFLFETQGDIYRSTDDGATWAEVTPDNDAYFSFAVGPAGEVYAGTGFYQYSFPFDVFDYGDIYRSTNNGASWSRVASKLDDFVYALAVTSKGVVIVGTGEGIYRSFGEFWHKLRSADTRSLVIQPTTEYIFAGTTGGIHRASPDGDNWDIVLPLPGNVTWSLVSTNDGRLYAGTETSGVLRSTDHEGLRWEPLNEGLEYEDVRSLTFNRAREEIFAGTNDGGVFRHVEVINNVTEGASSAGVPNAFVLHANTPNPFNPSTRINYDLPQAVEVRLHIFDIAGRHVRTLVNQTQPAGRYAITWDGRNEHGRQVASGTFICCFQAGSFMQTRRMALVR